MGLPCPLSYVGGGGLRRALLFERVRSAGGVGGGVGGQGGGGFNLRFGFILDFRAQ